MRGGGGIVRGDGGRWGLGEVGERKWGRWEVEEVRSGKCVGQKGDVGGGGRWGLWVWEKWVRWGMQGRWSSRFGEGSRVWVLREVGLQGGG